jgi:acyl-CoA thioester hydrolase
MGRQPHRLPVRVYYEDTDFSGVVYHANYLRFLERGRTELLRSAGVDQSILHAEPGGIIFAVRRMSLEYVRPARMDDLLTVETGTSEIRGASLRMSQRILREDIMLLTAEVHVAVLAGGKPARLPDEIRRLLQAGDP